MVKEELQVALAAAVRGVGLEPPESLELALARDARHGDFSSNVAMLLAKQSGQPPRSLAQAIVERLQQRSDLGVEVSVAGPGFINFRLLSSAAAQSLRALWAQGDAIGATRSGAGVRLQLEYVSANPTGPLNVVNARAAAFGSTLAAILRATGYEVESEFYVNDAGRQVELLGASTQVRWFELHGQQVEIPADGYHGDYVRDLAGAVPDQDALAWNALPQKAAWQAFGAFAVARILTAQRADLERFGVRYERWFRESELHASGAVGATLQLLRSLGHTYEQDGATFFRSTTWKDDKDRVVVRSGGEPTYFLADAAYHRDKYERRFRHVIDVWGPDHHGHIVRMQALARAFGFPADWLEVVIVQWVKLVEGGAAVKMSKRAGQLVTLAELLDEVGADAAKYFFLMRQQNAHLDFDLDLARRQSDDNPVFYVKYAHARICSVIRKAAEVGLVLDVPGGPAPPAPGTPRPEQAVLERLQQAEESALVRLLVDYPDLLRRAGTAREPHRLTGYCDDLARAFHKFYHEHRVIQDDRELALARLALCHATRQVLASALALMSIEAPQSM